MSAELDRQLDAMTPAEERFLEDQERRIARHLRGFLETADAFRTIREKRLYRQFYPTFESYCESRWSIGRSYGAKLADAGEVVEDLRRLSPRSPVADLIKGFHSALEAPKTLSLPAGLMTHPDGAGLRTAVHNVGMTPVSDDQEVIDAEFILDDDGQTVPLPTNERQTRPLYQLPTEKRREAWIEAVRTAPGGEVTSRHVAEVVERLKEKPSPLPFTEAEIDSCKDGKTTPLQVSPRAVPPGTSSAEPPPANPAEVLQARYELAFQALSDEYEPFFRGASISLIEKVLEDGVKRLIRAQELLFKEAERAEKSGSPTPLIDRVLRLAGLE